MPKMSLPVVCASADLPQIHPHKHTQKEIKKK
jgi:hypothetical protein